MAAAEIELRLDRLVARAGDRVLFEYVFEPELPRELAPRPYFHPVRTLGGVVITDHQPADHRWHLGIAYSWPVVNLRGDVPPVGRARQSLRAAYPPVGRARQSLRAAYPPDLKGAYPPGGLNFWGGPTFVRGHGYQHLDNHGLIRHRGSTAGEEQLEWLDRKDARIALERRRLGVPEVAADAGSWSLELDTEIENSSPGVLRLGSPTTEGRPMAGYAGLAWRGPDVLRDAAVLLENAQAAPSTATRGDVPRPGQDPMGRRARWLAVAGGGATIAIAEHPANPGVPNRWFVRTEEYPLVTSSPVFDRYLELEPGRSVRLRHRLLVADGVWSAQRLAQELQPWLQPVT